MLKRLGFHEQWIHWIRGCLVFSLVSDLVNKSPSKEFIPQRGLRQSDPLTPFVTIMAKGLSDLIRETISIFFGDSK